MRPSFLFVVLSCLLLIGTAPVVTAELASSSTGFLKLFDTVADYLGFGSAPDHSASFLPSNSSGCFPSDALCANPGWSQFRIDCDSDGRLDVVCLDVRNNMIVQQSSDNCATLLWKINTPGVCVAAHQSPCLRPVGWCRQRDAVYNQMDCDGDGSLDHLCRLPNGMYGTILSRENCTSDFPSARPLATVLRGCKHPNGSDIQPVPMASPSASSPSPRLLETATSTDQTSAPAVAGISAAAAAAASSGLSDSQTYSLVRWGMEEMANFDTDYCYRPSYGRGIGSVPGCAAGQEQDGLLCYPPCPSALRGVGPVCWADCPSGFTDTGVDCLKPGAYGRGVGRSCLHGFFQCDCNDDEDKYGLMCYPKCSANHHNVGCCVCSPDCPSGFPDVGISCQKPTATRGAGVPLSSCPSGKQLDAGLCYDGCSAGYHGIGPVCWYNCQGGQSTDCAAGCAKSGMSCASATISMVTSPIMAAVSIVSLGVGGEAAEPVFKAGTVLSTITKGLQDLWAASAPIRALGADAVKVAILTMGAVKDLRNAMFSHVHDTLHERLDAAYGADVSNNICRRVSDQMVLSALADVLKSIDVQLMELVDPTGLVAVFDAYMKPLCAAPTQPPRV